MPLYDLRPWFAGRGLVGAPVTTTTDTSLTTSVADCTNVTITFTAEAGRRYRVVAIGRLTSASATINVFGIITDSSNVQQGRSSQVELTNIGQQDLRVEAFVTPSAGSVTYKLRANTGSGTATFDAASGFEHMIYAEDVGPA